MIVSKHKDPQFPFNKYQIGVQIILALIIHAVSIDRLHVISRQHNLGVSPSYLGMRDSHDFQWEAFRSNFIMMVVIAVVWRFVGSRNHPSVLGLGMITFMFRADVIFYLGVILFSYFFSVKLYKNRRFELMKWMFVISTIGIVEYFNRLKELSSWMSDYIPVEQFKSSHCLLHWASILNMSLLKMLSFGVDIHRAHFHKQALARHYQKCKNCLEKTPCLKARDMFPSHKPTFSNYINYILFPGTLLAGPPITYNAFHSFKTVPMDCKNPIPRFFLMFAVFELAQVIVFEIDPKESMSLVQLSLASLVSLLYIWAKFNIIWKWAKVWSYIEGIEVVDNMNRCVLNNYCFQGFWRMWHRGFNIWLIRYMYIPLGGNKAMIKSYLCVFLFVAFWHDPQLKLLVWALVILLFIIPQVVVKRVVRQRFSHLYPTYWFKYLSALVGAVYVYLMCIANIIGFGLGFQGVWIVLRKMREQWVAEMGLLLVVTMFVNLMFFIRFMEKDDYGY